MASKTAKSAAAGAAAGSAFGPVGTALGAIGGSAISAIGNFFTNKSNQKAQNALFDKQAAFSKSEREAQQNWIEQMYEKNNAYNSPAAQMQRFKEAGLNPDLIYGQLGDSTASSPSPASQASTPSAGAFTNVNPLQGFGDTLSGLSMQQAQIEAIKAQTGKTNAETKQLNIQNEALPDSLRQQLSNMFEQGKLTAKEIEEKNVQIQQIEANIKSIYQGIENAKANLALANGELDFQKLRQAMETEAFQANMRGLALKYDIDKQQLAQMQALLPRLLKEKDLSIQQLSNQIYLSSQEVEYQKGYGDSLIHDRYMSEKMSYYANAREAESRAYRADGDIYKGHVRKKYLRDRYGDPDDKSTDISLYAKFNVMLSDMVTVLTSGLVGAFKTGK